MLDRAKHLLTLRNKMSRLFVSYLSMLLVPIVISMLAYVGVEKQTRKQSLQIGEAVIQQMGAALDQTLLEAENMANTLMSNRRVHTYANALEPSSPENVYSLLEISYDLRNYMLNSSHISGFFLYFPNSGRIMTKSAAYTPRLFYEYVYGSRDIEFDTFLHSVLEGHSSGMVAFGRVENRKLKREELLYKITLPGAASGSVGANIFLLIDISSLQTTFRTFGEINPDSKAVIVDRYGQTLLCLSAGGESEMSVRREFEEGLYRGGRYLTSSVASRTGLGLDYVIWQPVNRVLEPVRGIRNGMLLALLGYVSLGIWMSHRMSEKTGAPIQSLLGSLQPLLKTKAEPPAQKDYRVDLKRIEEGVRSLAAENKSSAQRLAEVLPVARNNILQALLYGNLEPQREPRMLLERYSLLLSDPFFFVLILDASPPSAGYGDIATTLAITEAVQIHAAGFSRFYCAELAGSPFCLIVNHRAFVPDEAVGRLAREIREELFYHSGLEASVYTGTCGEGLASIARSYREALQALQYRAVIPGNAVIEYGRLPKSSSLIRYGQDVELGLQSALHRGDSAEADGRIDRLYEEHALKRSVDPFMVHCLVVRIFLTLIHAAENIGCDLYGDPALSGRIREVLRLDAQVERSNQVLKEIASALCGYVRENQDRNLMGLKSRAEELIARELQNADLSQTFLAQELGVSAPYLSAFFKEKFGKNMVEYIQQSRCALAKQYLRDTDWTVAEIALRVGLIDSAALIRTFKKCCGITPGQFRKQMDGP